MDLERAAVERMAERRRQLHRARLPPGTTASNLAERVTAVPANAGALRRATAAGWVPCVVVVDGVLGEELRVWWRPANGRVLAAFEPFPEPGPPRFVPRAEARERWGVG